MLTFDFSEMLVGVAEYDDGPTGTTVFYFPDSVKAAVDVRGGAPGTVNAAALMNSREDKMMEVVAFSGGSWYGLSAATGAANAVKELKAAEGEPDFITGAVGAIIFDVGRRRMSRITPDDRLGRAAVETARPGWFPLGPRGAGRFAMQGYYFQQPFDADGSAGWPHSGQGGAFRQIGPTKIGVFTVVNALGTIVGRDGRVVRCSRNDPAKARPLVADLLKDTTAHRAEQAGKAGPTSNTTVTLVVTNQKMPFADLQRLARQVHSSMGRAIQPFATEQDGDVLYAVTTDQVENPALSSLDLSVIASELAWDAVLSSVPDLPPPAEPADANTTEGELQNYVGEYVISTFSRIEITLENGSLWALYDGVPQMYFWQPRHRLLPAGDRRFVIDLPARDVIELEVADGAVTGLTLNPGPWAIRARRTEAPQIGAGNWVSPNCGKVDVPRQLYRVWALRRCPLPHRGGGGPPAAVRRGGDPRGVPRALAGVRGAPVPERCLQAHSGAGLRTSGSRAECPAWKIPMHLSWAIAAPGGVATP